MIFRTSRSDWSEAGVVLITTLFLMTLLLVVIAAGLALSRTDLMITRNLLSGVQALWIARSGTEVGKNWLETNLTTSSLPVTLGPTTLANGTYTVEVVTLGSGVYQLTATGLGPEGSRRVVEERVRLPDFSPAGVITNEGDGLHPDFDDHRGGIGRRIPDFTTDGRNHAPDGTLSSLCPAVASFTTTQTSAQNDLTAAANILKHEIVTRANTFCLANGSSTAAGVCTPGLSWIRGIGALPRFTSDPCVATASTCYLNLDLSAAALRATALPPASNLPSPPQNRGPFAPTATSSLPFARTLTTPEQTRLHTALDDIERRVGELPPEKLLRITGSLTSGTHIYGTTAIPKVTQIEDGASALEISGGAIINGVGILLVPRVLQLRNATLNWQGIIMITGDGDLRVEDPAACGQIAGAVIIRDDPSPDRKFDLDLVERNGSCSPFAVNYSCEAVTRALTILMQTVSWIEKFDG